MDEPRFGIFDWTGNRKFDGATRDNFQDAWEIVYELRIKIHKNAANDYHARCYAGVRSNDTGVYHDRFRVARLERMGGKTYDVQAETADFFILEPNDDDGLCDLGELVDKRDCEVV